MRFKILRLQINDTLILANKIFAAVKEIKLQKANLLAKACNQPIIHYSIKFNKGFITFATNWSLFLNQKRQYKCFCLILLKKSLSLVNSRDLIKKLVIFKD